MALNNYYDYIKGNSIYYRIIIYGVLFLILLNFFMNIWGYKKVAIYKSKNMNNIIEGCAYYGGGYKDKHGYDNYYVIVNGGKYRDSSVLINKFPFIFKLKEFYGGFENGGSDKCYRIKYIKINFVNRVFIYDYIG